MRIILLTALAISCIIVAGDTERALAVSDTDITRNKRKILVAYYSATGNTAKVAGYISEALGSDTFVIEPVEPYTEEELKKRYAGKNSRIWREIHDKSLRKVPLKSTKVEKWDLDDTVFIGYPIWAYVAAWPVNGFIEANDFAGKTVIPFCTSGGSELGKSGELLAKIAGTGNLVKGRRFREKAERRDVFKWLKGLGFSVGD